jgi:CheY-like chemotaxis protein
MKVLLIDDSKPIVTYFAVFLEGQTGFEVRVALSGAEALELVSTFQPDVVVTDLIMPGMHGLDLITHLRSDFAPPVPKIIALSGFPDLEQQARARGADAFHIKPLEAADLLAVIRALVDASPPPREVRAHTEERRRIASERAEAAIAAHLVHHPDLLLRLRRSCQIISRYFDGIGASILFMERGQLKLFASSQPHFAMTAGSPLSGVLRFIGDVVESGSTLVVANVDEMPAFRPVEGEPRLGLLISTPLLTPDGIAIGGLTLTSEYPHPFDAADLSIIEHIGQCATAGIAAPEDRPLFTESMALRSRSWKTWLSAELAHLGAGRSLGIAVVETMLPELDSEKLAKLWERLGTRMAYGESSPGTLWLYKLGSNEGDVQRSLHTAMEQVGEVAGLRFTRMPTRRLAWSKRCLGRRAKSGPARRCRPRCGRSGSGCKPARDGARVGQETGPTTRRRISASGELSALRGQRFRPQLINERGTARCCSFLADPAPTSGAVRSQLSS